MLYDKIPPEWKPLWNWGSKKDNTSFAGRTHVTHNTYPQDKVWGWSATFLKRCALSIVSGNGVCVCRLAASLQNVNERQESFEWTGNTAFCTEASESQGLPITNRVKLARTPKLAWYATSMRDQPYGSFESKKRLKVELEDRVLVPQFDFTRELITRMRSTQDLLDRLS